MFIVRRQVFVGRRRQGVTAQLNISFCVRLPVKDNSKATFSFFLFPSARCQDLRRKKVAGTYLFRAGRREETISVYKSDVKVFEGRRSADITALVTTCQGKVESHHEEITIKKLFIYTLFFIYRRANNFYNMHKCFSYPV